MIWYLIVCATGFGTSSSVMCLPMQRMASRSQCEFVGSHYRALAGYRAAHTRCIALAGRKEPDRG